MTCSFLVVGCIADLGYKIVHLPAGAGGVGPNNELLLLGVAHGAEFFQSGAVLGQSHSKAHGQVGIVHRYFSFWSLFLPWGKSGGRKHIFNKNPITAGRVIHQHVGDGADEFAVLQNGAARHSLDNPVGFRQQFRVGDLNTQVFDFR